MRPPLCSALAALALLTGGLSVGCSPAPDAATTDDEAFEDEDAPYAPPEEFSAFVGDFGDYSWVVLFAQAPMDAVSEAYGKTVGQSVTENVPVTATDEAMYGPSGTIAQVKGSDWVQVCHRVGVWEDFDAAAFAETLNAPVLIFQGEDTSGSVSLERHAPGEPVQTFLTSDDRDLTQEHADSIGADPPPADAEIVEDYDAALASLGVVPVRLMIGAPAAGQDYPDGTGGVIAPEAEAAKLERVDATPAPLN
ncbi:hypothetical protein [Alienimonas californiensis]|uniref:Uncharacterized protein n=1 Tax=Alienimonas californiensis TaxID=2527989 RepID=A0A517P6Z9_9PLAN|nr:hypothetical protein [Alienimonas californiensis]QDT15133.1 hypothetical protein CA12_12140 [Alienimonas californiensis]